MNCKRTQGFYENGNALYASWGMKGHGGIDEVCGFNSVIFSPLEGEVINVLDKTHPASDGYWAVYILAQFNGELGELCVGHCNEIWVKKGDKIQRGTPLGLEGNHGQVFENGVLITNSPTLGHHRHWQWRPVIKTPLFNHKKSYLNTWGQGTYRDKEGFFYQVRDQLNGFNGLSPKIEEILDYVPPTVEKTKTLLESLKGMLQRLLVYLNS